ncbi:TetR family transcriptional regulator [Suttonella sp. R2A3]|uniref:TetR family transcriptional regulator n=1 Tax=Suttonella sp. R2A3 TaxID=2908648 RepID=UPI002880619F|nr:TetR family transcriptional regulator [Suttonella sp. R2A3]
MRRTKAEAEQTRQSLLDAALALFSEQGYESTSLAEIARTAGTTRGAIYWHFKNKADMLNALSEAHTQELFAAIEPSGDHEKTWDVLIERLIRLSENMYDNPPHRQFCLLLQQEAQHPDSQAIFTRFETSWNTLLTSAIRHSQAQHETPQDIDVQWAIFQIGTMMAGIIRNTANHQDNQAYRRYIPSIIRSTIAMIRDNRQVPDRNKPSHNAKLR